jgi:hypothetical protein
MDDHQLHYDSEAVVLRLDTGPLMRKTSQFSFRRPLAYGHAIWLAASAYRKMRSYQNTNLKQMIKAWNDAGERL